MAPGDLMLILGDGPSYTIKSFRTACRLRAPGPLVLIMRQCSAGKYLADVALAHHAGAFGACTSNHWVSMMLEYSTVELSIRAAFMHHGDKLS